MKRIIQRIFSLFGYQLINIDFFKEKMKRRNVDKYRGDDNDMDSALRRLKANGIEPELIVDVGAAKGKWTESTLKIWQSSDYILIEPIQEQINSIPNSLKQNQQVVIHEGVAGSEAGSIKFTVNDDLDGSGVYGKGKNMRDIPVIALDDIVKDRDDRLILLKLDTHGFEIPIFKGAEKTLNSTIAIVVEVYGFFVSPTAKLFHEISKYLETKGFRLFDIVDVRRRASDQAFWQADAIYLRDDHAVFSDNAYR